MRKNSSLWTDAHTIIHAAISNVLPDAAVTRALSAAEFPGRVFLVATGKAAWQMSHAAIQTLRTPLSGGIVITKYGHVKAPLPGVDCYEAGHPIPDENTLLATEAALALTAELKETDTVLFLLSGGGSALFEKPCIPLEELQSVTEQLLASGADIVEINTIRKHLSRVKGGRFAAHCFPARVFSVVLSDILGAPLDMIASGPAFPDSTTGAQALAIAEKYGLRLSETALACMKEETPKSLPNVTTQVTGSVRELCLATAEQCRHLGYEPFLLTDSLCCEAKEAGSFLSAVARTHCHDGKSMAFIAGGETVVHLTGSGKGGRNQELALSAASGIDGMENVLIFSVGSDGTDGPTDAAGGIVDGESASKLRALGLDSSRVLKENDAYHALKAIDGLLMTGPTGTNVNDVSVVLIRQ